jgi:lysozyme
MAVWIAGFVLAVGVAVAAAPRLYPYVEIAPLLHEVVGVDVSNHQGEIDWPALKRSGIGFAYIKATEGGDFKDKSFARNWAEAERAGIPRGAYHFYRFCSVTEDARNFTETVPKDPSALPPVVDVEVIGPCTATLTEEDQLEMLSQLLDVLEQHYGRRPIIYTTPEFDRGMLAGRFERERFWLRSLVLPPLFRRDRWVIWQYHSRGRRPGVRGRLDLDVFRGTRADFERFVEGEPPAARMQ